PAMPAAEALAGAGAGAMPERADRAEPDALAASPTLADAGQAEAARTESVADLVTPHVSIHLERIGRDGVVCRRTRSGRWARLQNRRRPSVRRHAGAPLLQPKVAVAH